MSSSLPQGNLPPSPPFSASSRRPEIAIEEQHILSQLEHTASHGLVWTKSGDIPIAQTAAIQLGPDNFLSPIGHRNAAADDDHGPSNASDARSVSSSRPSSSVFWKRLSRIVGRDPKIKETVPTLGASSVSVTLVRFEGCIQSGAPDSDAVPVSLRWHSSADPVETSSFEPAVPATQMRPSPTADGSIRLDIFSENIAKAIYKTDLPKPHARIDRTPQLVYCCNLLSMAPGPLQPTSDSDVSQDSSLDNEEKRWVQLVDPVLQDRYRWLVEQLVRAFADNPLKASDVITEIVLVGPVLERDTYRSLLSCFISKFEQTTALDVTLLQGLVQLVECASAGYLVDDDLVRIATVLSKELSITHNGTSDHSLHLTLSLARVLDVMVASKVKDLNRERDHQPMLQILNGLKSSDNVVQKYEVTYAYQALQYVPDDETPLQVLWRYAKVAAAGAGAVSSVFKLDPEGLLKGIESLQEIGAGAVEAVSTGIEVVETIRVGAGGVVRVSESKFEFMKKRSWYLALQGTGLFIRQGRLLDFNLVSTQAACRHNANFQWGICRQLGEIAVDPLWDDSVRQQTVDFLGELFRSGADWKPHVDVKRWILTILVQISELSDVFVKDHALALLTNLKKGDMTEFPGSYPLSRRLPLPLTSPLLAKVQEIPKLEYNLHILRSMRIADYKQAVYIDPMAKLSLQDTDDNLFSLMDKVRDFIASDTQVMLVLGDSGAGKSTFNRHLEHELWQEYKSGGRIPLFVNLPSLERPEKDLIAEQLKTHNFLEDQIHELKLHRQFMLICDGYDESQLTSNLHNTNLFNQSGQWDVKMLITCRTQYLGPDYWSRFEPKSVDQYTRVANDLFQQAVIASFTRKQIEDYVERYVPLETRTWVKKDYMDKLEAIPNLMDLVRNPFLLTLSLEALPTVVQGKTDLSRLRITRAKLYDTFVTHWMAVNKRRLENQRLDRENQLAFEELLEVGFEESGVKFQQDLAVAIFVHQDGRPVVDYITKRDKSSWKAAFFSTDCETSLLRGASLLSRAGTHYRFVHRSILEYFFACAISGPTKEHDEFDPPVHSETPATSSTISGHPLSQRNLVVEHSIIRFLAERVQLDSGFKDELLAIIELSKTDDQASRAAANAITILVKAGVRFNGADLRGIRVAGADMSGGQFDSAQLQEADLTGVNLSKSWIRQVDFTRTQMERVQFGEMPYLKESAKVLSCAYSPDGTLLAVGLCGSRINIYDTFTWKTTRTFKGHQGSITSIAYSPSGHQLLSGSSDRTARLWDCESGSCVFVLIGHTDEVLTVTFSPSGKQVASAGKDKTVRLWDFQTGANLFNLTGHTDWIRSISYSPDGYTVVSVVDDGMIRFFDTQTGQPGEVWKGQRWDMKSVVYSPGGQEIAVGHDNGELQLYNTTTGKPTRNWKAHVNDVASVVFSKNSQWIATCGHDYTVKVWDAATGSVLSVFTGHSASVCQVAFSPNGLQLASCSSDCTIRLWHVSSLGTGMDVEGGPDPLTSVLFSPNGRVLFCGTNSGAVRQYDAVSGESGLTIACRDDPVKCLAISPDGLRIASVGAHKRVATLRNIGADQADFVLDGHIQQVNTIAFSADSCWIATGGFDGTVRLWDARSGILDRVLEGHTYSVVCLEFWPNSHRILSGSSDGDIREWDLDSRECRFVVDAEGDSIHFRAISNSPNGWKVASVPYVDCYVDLWDTESGQRQQRLWNDGCVLRLAFSSCGQWVAVGLNCSVCLWNIVAGMSEEGGGEWKCLVRVHDIIGDVIGIAWRPDTLEFSNGCEDGAIQVWRLVETSSTSNTWSAQLVWRAGNLVLAASGAVFADAVGLSSFNQQLLTQRCKGTVA